MRKHKNGQCVIAQSDGFYGVFSSLPLGKEKKSRTETEVGGGGYTLIGAAEALKKEAHIIFSICLLVTEEIKSSPNAMFFPRFQ